eukprot:3713563-Pyramimonas_sp.AAC.1
MRILPHRQRRLVRSPSPVEALRRALQHRPRRAPRSRKARAAVVARARGRQLQRSMRCKRWGRPMPR